MNGFDEEQTLKLEQMKVDIKLKGRQFVWETPRNLAILVGAVAAIAGALGFKLGSQPSAPTIIYYVPAPGLQMPAPPLPSAHP